MTNQEIYTTSKENLNKFIKENHMLFDDNNVLLGIDRLTGKELQEFLKLNDAVKKAYLNTLH